MTVFLDNLHSHVFTYIALVILIATALSILLSRNECTTLPSGDCSAKRFVVGGATFLAVLILIILTWGWIVLLPVGYGHRDEIALLTAPLIPTIGSGRFFPLGHMEFDIISLSLTGGNLAPLYILPFLQLVLVVFLIDYIISPASTLIRIYAIALSFALALVVPFSNLIIPERNAIFFLLASICFIKYYQENPGFLAVAVAVGAAGLSLYYKEPMFALWLGVAFGLFWYDFGSLVRYARASRGQGQAPRLLGSIQFGLFLSSVFFLLGYGFFVFYKGAPETYYAGNRGWVGLPDRFLTFVRDVPMLSLPLVTGIGAHLFIARNSFDRVLVVSLCMGCIGYVSTLIVLSMPLNGYYYAIPILMQVITSAILLKHLTAVLWGAQGRDIKPPVLRMVCAALFGASLLYGMYTVTKNVYKSVFSEIANKKNYIEEYAFLHSELKALGDFRSVYYAPLTTNYADYGTAILMIFINKSGIDHKFDIYSHSGCAVWNESYNGGLIHCVKKDFKITDGYDVLVIENDSLASDYLSDYQTVRFDSPFAGNDGKHNSITIAKKITRQ